MTPAQIEQALEHLYDLQERRRMVDQEIDDLVAALRSPDMSGRCAASWVEVAEALGVTKQTVQYKYRHLSWLGDVNEL